MIHRTKFTLERRFCSHKDDGASVTIFVDTSKKDWYDNLVKATKCTKIVTLEFPFEEIKNLPLESLEDTNFIADGWGPGFANELMLPMVYNEDYFDNFEIWFNQLEKNICTSIVNHIMKLDGPSKFKKMMNHKTYRETIQKHKIKRNPLHISVFEAIKTTILDDYYDNHFKVNEYDIKYLKENMDRIVHDLLGYVKACIVVSGTEYTRGYEMMKELDETCEGQDSYVAKHFDSVVHSALRDVWGGPDYQNRGHDWIHNDKCQVPRHYSGLYDRDKNWSSGTERFALFAGLTITSQI